MRRDRGRPLFSESKTWPAVRLGLSIDALSANGLPLGALILISAAEGIGKSTYCIRVLEAFARSGNEAIYGTFEMSPSRVDLLALRAGLFPLGDTPGVMVTTQRPVLEGHREKPALIVLDSAQIFPVGNEGGDAAEEAVRWAHRLLKQHTYLTVLMISQLNAEGEVFGTRSVRHWVDVVAELEEEDGNRYFKWTKNRFGEPRGRCPL